MFKITGAVKNYEWGKIGQESEVYKLLSSDVPQNTLDIDVPFAELWMGTHPSGVSYIAGTEDTSLAEYVSKYVECVGSSSKEKFGRTLPFLLKVLSVNKALSIQAHPTKEHAKELNEQRPDLYKDDNHKPEMAIALTPFEALVGFRSPVEIAGFVQGVRELLKIVGPDCLSDLNAASTGPEDMAGPAIKEAYRMLMCTEENKVACLVNDLKDRLIAGDNLPVIFPPDVDVDLNKIAELFIRLATDFPGDVGCFSLFFLNYICLEPGEAIFLEANLPHAYLSGDCIECMACSDNVVRAGLTPKFKDVDCLLSMLNYYPRTRDDLKFAGTEQPIEYITSPEVIRPQPAGEDEDEAVEAPVVPRPRIISYKPPVEDFAIDQITVPSTCHAFELVSLPSASILLFVQGSGFLQRIPTVTAKNLSKHSDPELVADEEQNEEEKEPAAPVVEVHPAGRVHETIEFTRGSVFFISADVACFIQPHEFRSSSPEEQQEDDLSVRSCIAFRAYVNLDS